MDSVMTVTRKNQGTRRKTCRGSTLCTAKPTLTTLELKTDLRVEKPTNNQLICGVVKMSLYAANQKLKQSFLRTESRD